ncbi:MAG: TrkH family potassium uptake protein [Bacteroidales bacterium]|nr:TrkH family potassium uptake protein [Bacteroidales bacterium]MBQ4013427.1 TrkH family potassium uptake protein [Bacteroidales bacterium]
MNLGVISRNVGIALICCAVFMFLSALVAALDGFDSSFSPLFLSAVLTMMVGVFPLIFVRRNKDINTREGLAILLIAWFLCCIFSMLPYVLWGGEFSLVNAWFESASGITTTGATILKDIEALPKGLLFWRSSTHYIGGLGVVVFIMMILPSFGTVRFKMSKMDVEDISRSNYQYKSNKFIRVVVSVYAGITVCSFFSLLLAGMPLFDAANHALSVTATGGFSIKNASIAAYDSPLIEILLIIFMIIASLHFGLIYASFATRTFKVFKNPITKFYLATILIASLLVTINLMTSGTIPNLWQALRHSFFTVVSTISTTGFGSTDTNVWPVFSILILMYAAIQCGCSGSTTSGLRSDRVYLTVKAARAQLVKIAWPNAVVQVKSGGQTIDRDMITSVSLYVLLYLIITLLMAVVYAAFGLDLLTSVSASVSMMSNVGPCFGSFGSSMSNFSTAPELAKVLMGIQMIIGRLGIYSILLVFVLYRKRA